MGSLEKLKNLLQNLQTNQELFESWKWEKKLPIIVNIPKKINPIQEVLEMIDIHVFGDESLLETCAVAYGVKRQLSGTKQRLI